MKALKFLRPGRVAPFTGAQWPSPGEWLEGGRADLCRSGIHALLPPVLPVWISEELWRVELEGGEELAPGIVVGERGRLLDRVDEWNDDTAREFARACAAHVRSATGRAAEYAADAATSAEKAVAGASTTTVAYMAAHAAEAAAPGTFAAERAWQARWLVERLALAAAL